LFVHTYLGAPYPHHTLPLFVPRICYPDEGPLNFLYCFLPSRTHPSPRCEPSIVILSLFACFLPYPTGHFNLLSGGGLTPLTHPSNLPSTRALRCAVLCCALLCFVLCCVHAASCLASRVYFSLANRSTRSLDIDQSQILLASSHVVVPASTQTSDRVRLSVVPAKPPYPPPSAYLRVSRIRGEVLVQRAQEKKNLYEEQTFGFRPSPQRFVRS
jgi:hypothetical protein